MSVDYAQIISGLQARQTREGREAGKIDLKTLEAALTNKKNSAETLAFLRYLRTNFIDISDKFKEDGAMARLTSQDINAAIPDYEKFLTEQHVGDEAQVKAQASRTVATSTPLSFDAYQAKMRALREEANPSSTTLAQSTSEHFSTADRLMEEGNYAEAVGHLKLAHQASPKNGLILQRAAECYEKMGQPAKAKPFYDYLIANSVTVDGKIYAKRAAIEAQSLNRDSLVAAINDYKTALSKSRDKTEQADIYRAMGDIYSVAANTLAQTTAQRQQCWSQAATAFDKALQGHHGNTQIMQLLANAHECSGNLNAASQYYDLAVKWGDDSAQGNSIRVASILAGQRPQGGATRLFASN